jgi:hypothetical protein
METADCPPGSLTNIGIKAQPWLYIQISRQDTRVITLWSYALRDYIFKSPNRKRTPTNILWKPES